MPFCRHWEVGNACEVSAKSIESMVVGASQNFKFLRQNT